MRALVTGLLGLMVIGTQRCACEAHASPVIMAPVQESQPGPGQKPADPKQATKDDETITKHRFGAGEADASGWYPATSTKGRFSVSLPNRFSDFTTVSSRPFGVASESYWLGTRLKAIQFTALGLTRGDGKPAAGTLQGAADLLLAKVPKASAKDKRQVTRKGIKGLEFTLSNRSWTLRQRVMLEGNTVYWLMVEYPTRSAEGAPTKDIERFFDSFELPKGKKPAP